MRYELKRSGEDYVKVYPYGTRFYKYSEGDLDVIKSEIERHVDNINGVDVVNEYNYEFKDEYTDYKCSSLKELCEEMAHQRDLIELHSMWELDWCNDNGKYKRHVGNFEDLLDEVSRHKGITVKGHLTEKEKILVDMAKLLQD